MNEKICLFCGKFMSSETDRENFHGTCDFCSDSCKDKYYNGDTHLSEETKEVIYNITKKLANE